MIKILIGGRKVGKLSNIDKFELDDIIKNLPKTLNYSYKCILHGNSPIANDKRYNLWIFRNDK